MSAPPVQMRPEDWAILQQILARELPGVEVWAFGSRARGDAKPFSDLDLAVITPAGIDLDRMAALREAFAASDLPWKVDVVDWARCAEGFRKLINIEHHILVASSLGCG